MQKKDSNGVGKSAMIDAIRMILGEKMPSDFKHKEELAKRDVLIVLKIENKDKIQYLARQIIDDSNGYVAEQVVMDIKSWKIYELDRYREYVQNIYF